MLTSRADGKHVIRRVADHQRFLRREFAMARTVSLLGVALTITLMTGCCCPISFWTPRLCWVKVRCSPECIKTPCPNLPNDCCRTKQQKNCCPPGGGGGYGVMRPVPVYAAPVYAPPPAYPPPYAAPYGNSYGYQNQASYRARPQQAVAPQVAPRPAQIGSPAQIGALAVPVPAALR